MKQFYSFIVSLFLIFTMLFGGIGCARRYSQYDSSPTPPTQDTTYIETDEEPPPQEYTEPTEMVVFPSENNYVYMIPNIFGVYFFEDSWYRYYNGHWFRAHRYNAPWVLVPISLIPGAVLYFPPEYALYTPPHYHRIPYHDFHTHWREWNRRQHWHQYDWYRHEVRDDIQRERRHNIEQERTRWHRGEGRPPVGFISDSEAKKRQKKTGREQEQRQYQQQERQRQEQLKRDQDQRQRQEQLKRDQDQRQRQEQLKRDQDQRQRQEQLKRDQDQRQRQEQLKRDQDQRQRQEQLKRDQDQRQRQEQLKRDQDQRQRQEQLKRDQEQRQRQGQEQRQHQQQERQEQPKRDQDQRQRQEQELR